MVMPVAWNAHADDGSGFAMVQTMANSRNRQGGQTQKVSKCGLYNCGGHDALNAHYNGDSNQCYYCRNNYAGNKSCNDGDIVGQIDTDGKLRSLYQCSGSGWTDDEWEKFEPAKRCSFSDTLNKNDPNTEYYLSIDENYETDAYQSYEDVVLVAGSNTCWYTKCKPGYYLLNKQCVRDTRASDCTASFGTWANNRCACDASKHLRLENGKCVCESNRYRRDENTRSCVLTDAARQEDERNAQRTAQQKCENSGGAWQNNGCVCAAANGLKTASGVCVCLDNNYRRNGKKCVLTDTAALKKECDKAAREGVNVYWDDGNKNCVCRDINKEFRGGKCETKQSILDCQTIEGAQWRGGGCYCVRDNYEIKNGKCVESESSLQQGRLEASKTRISKSVSALNSIKSGFDISRWKDEEGKFNTARLASDSIAGVVLGTAGGLITSNVIKKNQVSNGFEDIQCTIGGQVVAGWDDQFTVGVR